MKQIRVKLNLLNGSTKTLDSVTLYEGEQYSTKIVINFENGFVRPSDQFYVEFIDKDNNPLVYNLTVEGSKASVLIPRLPLSRGKLKYTIVRYNDAFTELEKFYPEPLFVTVAGDIAIDTLEKKPDVFADLNHRLLEIEKKLGLK